MAHLVIITFKSTYEPKKKESTDKMSFKFSTQHKQEHFADRPSGPGNTKVLIIIVYILYYIQSIDKGPTNTQSPRAE